MSLSRIRNGAVCAAVLLIAQPRSAATQEVFELQPLAPGIFAAEVLRNPAAYAFANSLVVIGDDGVLVVDTQQSLTAARALIAHIARLTRAPVRWVVNTHWHGDHVNGNQAYRDAHPGVQFIGHESLTDDLENLGSERRRTELIELPASIEQRRLWLREGSGPDGATLTEADRASLARSLALREAYSIELAMIDPPPPTITVSERMSLIVGAHEVRVLYAGPAHTRGDLMVYLPDSGVLAVGDLLEAGLPYFDDAYPAGWLRAVSQIRALQPSIIVPSHGRATRDTALIAEAEQLLAAIVADAASGASSDSVPTDEASMQRLWESRYGVSAAAFRSALQKAIERARLERRVQ